MKNAACGNSRCIRKWFGCIKTAKRRFKPAALPEQTSLIDHAHCDDIGIVEFLSQINHLGEMPDCGSKIQPVKRYASAHLMGIGKKLLCWFEKFTVIGNEGLIEVDRQFLELFFQNGGLIGNPQHIRELYHVTARGKQHL